MTDLLCLFFFTGTFFPFFELHGPGISDCRNWLEKMQVSTKRVLESRTRPVTV